MASERGEYRPIRRVLLDGNDFQKLSERARCAFVFLKINLGPAGIEVHYPEALHIQLAAQTGMPVDALRTSLNELEAAGWIARELNVTWVIEQLRYDPHMDEKNDKHRTGIQRHVAGLPRLAIVRRFIEHYPAFFEGIPNPTKGYPKATEGLSVANRFTEDGIPKTENRKDSVSNETGKAEQESFPQSGDKPLTEGDLMGLIRKHFYAPDGKPPTNWAEGREFSVIRQLRKKGVRLDQIAEWIEGTAAIRDDDGLVSGEIGRVDWLHKGDKLTMRALYNTSSGVMPVCQLAEIKLAERSKAASRDRSTFGSGRVQISISPKAAS